MAADRKSNTNSQSMRRIKFGLNVLIAVIVATALVVLCNVIAYRQFVRFDFTATRQYSVTRRNSSRSARQWIRAATR